MKKLFLSLLSLLVTTTALADVNIRYSTFPDANFRAWLLEQSYGADGVLTDAEIANVKVIDIYNKKNIKSLKGIEYFTALVSLDCTLNQITSLDLSGCKTLKRLNSDANQMTSLNLSGCTSLESISCDSNPLTSLIVSGCTSLKYITCCYNSLTSLDLDGCTALETFRCYDSQLSSLDASDCTSLNRIICRGNQLTSLRLAGNSALTMELECYENNLKGAAMDILVASLPDVSVGRMYAVYDSNEGNIITKSQVAAANEKGWIVYKYDAINGWQEYEGSGTFVEIDENNFPDASFRNWLLGQTYGVDGVLTEEEIANVLDIDVFNNGIQSLKGIEYFTALKSLTCNFNKLTTLDISNNTELESLVCYANQLTSLDVSNNTKLKELFCSRNQLRSLDVSKNTDIKSLSCYDNQLTSLDLSNNIKLTTLYCHVNQITTEAMDVLVNSLPAVENGYMGVIFSYMDGNTMTTTQVAAAKAKGWTPYCIDSEGKETEYEGSQEPSDIGVEINETNFPDENFRKYLLEQTYGSDGILSKEEIAGVKSINVSKNGIASLKGIEFFTALTGLTCYENQLTSLDVSQNTALTSLSCDGNQLSSLDISKNIALTKLECCENQLTSLDVTQNTELKYLDCGDNNLSSLDVSNNTELTGLNCYLNLLTTLDVSKNVELKLLDCSANLLTSLDVSNNTKLKELYYCKNYVKGDATDALIKSLPTVEDGELVAIYYEDESNEMTAKQVAKAKAKGWTPYYFDGEDVTEYAGSGAPFVRGDVNGDGIVNGTDIQTVINLIVAGEYDENADVNEDEVINGTDIQEIINIIIDYVPEEKIIPGKITVTGDGIKTTYTFPGGTNGVWDGYVSDNVNIEDGTQSLTAYIDFMGGDNSQMWGSVNISVPNYDEAKTSFTGGFGYFVESSNPTNWVSLSTTSHEDWKDVPIPISVKKNGDIYTFTIKDASVFLQDDSLGINYENVKQVKMTVEFSIRKTEQSTR